jgi:hypothetical protein
MLLSTLKTISCLEYMWAILQIALTGLITDTKSFPRFVSDVECWAMLINYVVTQLLNYEL